MSDIVIKSKGQIELLQKKVEQLSDCGEKAMAEEYLVIAKGHWSKLRVLCGHANLAGDLEMIVVQLRYQLEAYHSAMRVVRKMLKSSKSDEYEVVDVCQKTEEP